MAMMMAKPRVWPADAPTRKWLREQKKKHRASKRANSEPAKPSSLERDVSRLLRRLKQNSEIEKENANLCRKNGKLIAAVKATIRSEVWACAANVAEEEVG